MRQKTDFIINDSESRDNGKKFLIEEMPAYQLENWCYRALNGIVKNGLNQIEILQNLFSFPAETMSVIGLLHLFKIDPEILEGLLSELMSYVKIYPKEINESMDKTNTFQGIKTPRTLLENDIEEAVTLMIIKTEVLKLNLNFLKTAGSRIINQLFPQNA